MELVKVLVRVTKYMEQLSPQDQRHAAFFIHRRWGGPLTGTERSRLSRANATKMLHGDATKSLRDDATKSLHGDATKTLHAAPTPPPVYPENTSSKTRAKTQELQGFKAFWLKYPKRIGKGAAQDSWHKHACEVHADLILKALESQRDFLLRDGGKYIPNPATWLNQHRWEDDPPQPTGLSDKTAGNIASAQAFIDRMERKAHDPS